MNELPTWPQADLQSFPSYPPAFTEAMDALVHCAQVCYVCADACLEEDAVDVLQPCIRRNLECAGVCSETARQMLHQPDMPPDVLHAQLLACLAACGLCSGACAAHASDYYYCAICARTCRNCQDRCHAAIAELATVAVH